MAINNGDLYVAPGKNLAENRRANLSHEIHVGRTCRCDVNDAYYSADKSLKEIAESQKEWQRWEWESHFKITSSQWLDSICMIGSKFRPSNALILFADCPCRDTIEDPYQTRIKGNRRLEKSLKWCEFSLLKSSIKDNLPEILLLNRIKTFYVK